DLVDNVGAGFSGTGNELNNTILGATEGGTLSGLGGDDLLVARNTQNTVTLRGGDGNDTLDGSGWHTQMFGDAGNDLLISGGGDDTMVSGPGNDTLQGGRGTDTLIGGAGNDTLTGDLGSADAPNAADHFIFQVTPGSANADVVTDFQSGSDQLHLDNRIMTALGPSGAFTTNDVRFYAAPGASGGHDADDRVVFDASSGSL